MEVAYYCRYFTSNFESENVIAFESMDARLENDSIPSGIHLELSTQPAARTVSIVIRAYEVQIDPGSWILDHPPKGTTYFLRPLTCFRYVHLKYKIFGQALITHFKK